MKDSNFIEEVINGDIHTANMKMAGLNDRSQAKTFIYALCYGAGPAKIWDAFLNTCLTQIDSSTTCLVLKTYVTKSLKLLRVV